MGFFKKSKKPEQTDPRQAAFKQNLRFIHQTTYTVDEIRPLFAPSGRQRCVTIGTVDFPTGKVVVADPLVYLYNPKYAKPLDLTIPVGSYPVELSVCNSPMAGLRVVAAKLKVTNNDIVRYELAMPDGATIRQLNEPGIIAGFGVDAGLASFCDRQTAEEYNEFLSQWYQQHPNANHYDDYYAPLFAESYASQPDVQRPGGDFIQWEVPSTGHRFCMFASGLGDGFYANLWGFDNQDRICELVIPFMNPALFE